MQGVMHAVIYFVLDLIELKCMNIKLYNINSYQTCLQKLFT